MWCRTGKRVPWSSSTRAWRSTKRSTFQCLRTKWCHGSRSHMGKSFPHSSKMVHLPVAQNWCKANSPNFWDKFMWPPSSPDLNGMDFAVWSILESRACSVNHHSVASLKAALEKPWAEIGEETVRAACLQICGGLEAVLRANGGHFEKLWLIVFYYVVLRCETWNFKNRFENIRFMAKSYSSRTFPTP